METGSTHLGRVSARLPWIESGAARLGVAVLVVLSVSVGFRYWIDQGDEQTPGVNKRGLLTGERAITPPEPGALKS